PAMKPLLRNLAFVVLFAVLAVLALKAFGVHAAIVPSVVLSVFATLALNGLLALGSKPWRRS
ncbi:MAG TPA: hypothetical protein RMG45_20000, partial [Polyangiaceae bacterium LLY-WYZ-15_(1-7)]|nr:hypothetical protein [Polyangiaceae bacterium LLY-WYZ-15_(1-7)]